MERQRWNWAYVTAAVGAVLIVACGRSNLDDYDDPGALVASADSGSSVDAAKDGTTPGPDGNVDGTAADATGDALPDAAGDALADAPGDALPPCNSTTCFRGCCDGAGACVLGNATQACGTGGSACVDCAAAGYDFCDAQARTCGKNPPPPVCGASTCATGCCDTTGACQRGTMANACGTGGARCQSCTASGRVCDVNQQRCTLPCNATTCGTGCCDSGGACQAGNSDGACGTGAQNCTSCTSQGRTCSASKTCVVPCGPTTCATGCCDSAGVCQTGSSNNACGTGGVTCQPCTGGRTCNASKVCAQPCSATCTTGCCDATGTCQTGGTDAQCGTGGQNCQSCTNQGRVCNTAKACVVPCNAATCSTGCCDSTGVCQTGSSNSVCGSGAASCQNCTSSSLACLASTPRRCAPTCEAVYGTCAAAVSTTSPVVQHVCAATAFPALQAACGTSPTSATCTSVLPLLPAACQSCLAPFLVPFSDPKGVYSCIAPFVSSSCNHSTGCSTDCLTKSCQNCGANALATCRSDALATQCQTLNGQASICQSSALQTTQAQFCDPNRYTAYGDWLNAVGQRYCL